MPENTYKIFLTKHKFTGAVILFTAIACLSVIFYTNKNIGAGNVAINTGIKISHETTYIASPLKANGLPDYNAYLNDKYGNNISFKESATFSLVSIFGLNSFYYSPKPEMVTAIHHALGVSEALPLKSSWVGLRNYKKSFADMRAVKHNLDGRQTPYIDRELKQWIKANDFSLDKALVASQLPHFFLPWVPPSATYLRSFSGGEFSELILTLAYRALAQLQYGDVDSCIEHLIALQRLGRLSMTEPNFLSWVDGAEAIKISNAWLVRLANSNELSKKQRVKMSRLLNAMPALPSLVKTLEVHSRMPALEGILKGAASGDETVINSKSNHIYDYNVLLKMINANEDKIQEVFAIVDTQARFSAFPDLWISLDKERELLETGRKRWHERRQEISNLKAGLREPPKEFALHKLKKQFPELQFNDRETALKQIMTYAYLFSNASIPDARQWGKREIDMFAGVQNTKVALALAQYRYDHGQYPEELKFIDSAISTVDLLSHNELIYRPRASGFLLYSVGENRKDDGGEKEKDIILDVVFQDSL